MSFVALLIFCFNISNLSTRVFVATVSALLATLVGWCIWSTWESTENDEVQQISPAVFRRTVRVLFERIKQLNPFHTRRAPQHSRITMTEVRV
jgi:hypothetical protein